MINLAYATIHILIYIIKAIIPNNQKSFIYHQRFSTAIRVSDKKPNIDTILIQHFSNIVPKNCSPIPNSPKGNVTTKNTVKIFDQNLFIFKGIILLAISEIIILKIVTSILENDVCLANSNDIDLPPLTHV